LVIIIDPASSGDTKTKKVVCGFLLLLLLDGSLNAKEIADVELPDEVRLDGSEQVLILNGAGIRKKFFISVYVAGLYLAEPVKSAAETFALETPKRVTMHILHSKITKDKIVSGWNDGFSANNSEPALNLLNDRLHAFNELFEDLYQGDRVYFDYLPGIGTKVTVKDRLKGTIPGKDFYLALLKVWLGKRPVAKSLKADLLNN